MAKVILLLNPVYVTLFWAIALSFENRKQKVPKLFLGRSMFVAFIVYLSHLFYFTGQYAVYYYMDSVYTLASLLVYPLFHIYVRLLTVDKWFSFKTHGKYLALPLIVFLMHLTGYMLMEKQQAIHYLTAIVPGNESYSGISRYMDMVYLMFRIVFVSQVFYYLYRNYRLISVHNNRIGDFYSNLEKMSLNWVQFFNFSMAATSLASATVAVLGRDMFTASTLYLVFPSVVFSVMLFLIGLLGNMQGDVKIDVQNDTHNSAHETVPPPERPPVPADAADKKNSPVRKETMAEESYPEKLMDGMENIFREKMIFRNPDLKIWDVCNMLGTNRTYVSKIINNHFNRNFCNHVNYYRVEYAKKLLYENRRLTNEEVADLSGFGSVNSLYRAFRLHEKKSLGDFRKEQYRTSSS